MDLLIYSRKSGVNIDNKNYRCQDEYGDYEFWTKESTSRNHYSSYYNDKNDTLYVLWGSLYNVKGKDEKTDVMCISEIYENLGIKSVLDVDGDFIFACFSEKGKNIQIVSDREGIMPVYYRVSESYISVSTQCDLFFDDFKEEDIDYNSINDYLRFGTLIGNRTMSKKVKLLQGGTWLSYNEREVNTKRLYKFMYGYSDEKTDILIEKIMDAYKRAIKKRVKENADDTCLFLSGGMDSRFLLAAINSVTDKKAKAYSFGQDGSEEVNVACECARLEGNSFEWIKLGPGDFVKNAEEYVRITCGGDMFPQGYILDAVKNIEESLFLTGFALDAYMGGTFINENAISTDEKMSDFVGDNLKLLKMNVFSKDQLQELALSESTAIFDLDIDDLVEEAKEYDEFKVADVVQAFGIDVRAKRTVLWREIVPAQFLDCSYVSTDIDFLRECAKIPAKIRLDHQFYYMLFQKMAPEYAKIVYNNTSLPLSAPVDLWAKGVVIESDREKLFEKIMSQYNAIHEDKIYYTHFYSDFNGYSRYDDEWKKLFEKYLLNKDAYIYVNLFDRNKVLDIYNEHLGGCVNRRKELIHLTSLEIFLSNALRGKKGATI